MAPVRGPRFLVQVDQLTGPAHQLHAESHPPPDEGGVRGDVRDPDETTRPGLHDRTRRAEGRLRQGLSDVPLPYERVLADALYGSDAHFSSMDDVEQSWRILDRVLEPNKVPTVYDPGT